ncbi:hypothetical protein FisN_18Lh248 [Fistulifera solaris]|uniref:Secondary thiamine-phosphate synthase enzyme n=1 Tax=Fistulifera solaris TaxID=1519565 RepID=A0A1Z5JU85_FISSO|nr:hypothetical protein FisN_18Lh248 [Fistulifera solaris]|eukprot:GAX17593.1 hypothetical protein FisN_18Lh248 [Fistulifera solaris]
MKRHSLYLLSLSISISICLVSSSFFNAQQHRLVDTCISPTTLVAHKNSDTETSTMKPLWFQHEITVTAPKRGCHLITADIQKAAGESIRQCQIGLCNIFVQHTSASLTINENADPDVRTDMETALNKIVPAQWNRDGTFRHTMEGDDDMPGHVKSSLMGVSLTIPIRQGRLALGTWQGIYLNEHRDQGGWGGGHARNIIITIQGQGK